MEAMTVTAWCDSVFEKKKKINNKFTHNTHTCTHTHICTHTHTHTHTHRNTHTHTHTHTQHTHTCTGKLPFAVSPDSMTQSEPSSTAFATSVPSARVGRGFLTMLSSICVAQMTGLPALLGERGWMRQ